MRAGVGGRGGGQQRLLESDRNWQESAESIPNALLPARGAADLKAKASCRRPQKLKIVKNMKNYKNVNLQKHIILVNLGLREYQNRIQHVHKSAHAKYELCSCQERRVMTILRPPGAKIEEQIGFVAARSCQELPGAARGCQGLPGSCQELPGTPSGGKVQEQLVAANPRSHAIFQICCSISCF